jgi:phosphoglucomutase
MTLSPLAGQPAPADILIDPKRLIRDYLEKRPDPSEPTQRVSFGTSGHRGSPLEGSFNEAHILATTQAICEYRAGAKVEGPLFMGMDTHAVSLPAQKTALEVLAANGVDVFIQREEGYTPTPAISHAILTFNRGRSEGLSDGIVITPSHNPPQDGGFKYNPTHGGPADVEVTRFIQDRANALLGNLAGVKRVPLEKALRSPTTRLHDFVQPYVEDLASIIDLEAIRRSELRIGVDPLGGASVAYWEPIRQKYGLHVTVTNPKVDPRFAFMTCDYDGRIRMDCSSPHAMASLIKLKDGYQIAFGNDTDADRHGIVTPSGGLMNPNHFLAVCVDYLFRNRPQWRKEVAVGKTLVSSSIIDRVTESMGRKLVEVPVGFKWFVGGLLGGTLGFGGEESAGASFLRKDGTVWTTDKDGLIPNLLAAEMTATTGKDPSQLFRILADRFGTPYYKRIDAPATPAQKQALGKLSPDAVPVQVLAGHPILAKLTRAPGNQAPIGGLKVTTEKGWFAARPSGTENVYKIYAESFVSSSHLDVIAKEAQEIVDRALLHSSPEGS